MGPHPGIRAEARQEIPGWDVWTIESTHNGILWSAKPQGASAAVPGCSGLPCFGALASAVRTYESRLPEHIEQTRKDLSETPESWTGRRAMLSQRLIALEDLAYGKAAEHRTTKPPLA